MVKVLLTTKTLIFNPIVRVIITVAVLILLLPIVGFYILHPQPQKNINYGVNFSKKYAQEIGLNWKEAYLTILEDLNVKNLRLVAYWDEIEKNKGTYDYSDIEWQLEEADKRNLNIILAIGRKVPRYPECHEPDWWKNTKEEKSRDAEVYKYIETTVNTLKKHKSIKHWQVENEPFFPFGTCLAVKQNVIKQEISIVRKLDKRSILIQDSGEGGFWLPSYIMSDYLGISMYRKVWYDFWAIFFKKSFYIQYPLQYWTYKIKADLLGIPYKRIIVTELQAEPWGPVQNTKLTQSEKDKTMSKTDFIDTINYANKTGFKDLYFWGAEWWLWEKQVNNNPFFWDTAKDLMK